MLTTKIEPARLKILPNQDFIKLLKSRVAASIEVKKQRATAGTYFKVFSIICWYLLSYAGLFFSTSHLLSIALCISLGIATSAVGFNIFHDSVHGSFSYHRWVNHAWAFIACTLIGPSHFVWKHKHNYLHHQFPNIKGWDDDLETRDGLRLSPSQPWAPRYRYQHVYAILIYSLTTLEWIYFRDFVRYFTAQMNDVQKLPKMKLSDHLEFWASKLIYFGFALVLPFSLFPAISVILGFLIVNVTTSLILAIIFQLAHVMEESQFPLPAASTGNLEMDWAFLQLATTVNFAPTNRLLSWYCGGLNFQVEHHLLPGVCHAHYKTLSPIVEATAKEFGYPYHSLPTHWQAMRNHWRTLKKFSFENT